MNPTQQITKACASAVTAGAVLMLGALAQALSATGSEQLSFTATHDTFIQRGSTANNGLSNAMMVKRESTTGSGGTDRIGYIRFDVPGTFAPPVGGNLILSFKSYPGDGTTPFTFRVYGLPDGHVNESFDETLLNFSNAANASTTLPGSLNPAGLEDLGTFAPAVATGATTVRFGGAALDSFLAANANQRVSFIIFRQTANGAATYLDSRQASSATLRPTLLVRSASDALPVSNTTASSSLAASSPALATDSDYDTRWTATADTSSTKSWITLDLGTPQTVNRLSLTVYQTGRSYKLESSANNSTWNTVDASLTPGTGNVVNTLQTTSHHYFAPVSARYFRLTSLTSTSGNSMSLWEAKLYQDPQAGAAFSRLDSLDATVAVLPNSSNEQKLKRVVLEIALERARASAEAGEFGHANLLMDDVDNHLAADPATMAAPVTGQPFIRALRPLKETTPETNPYIKRMADGVALFLATAESPFRKNTPVLNVFSDFNLARNTAEQMDTLLWLFAHPDSPRQHDPEILRRLLRRTHAYLDAIKVHGPTLSAGQLASFYDDFAIAPASIVFREFQALYPGLIPTNTNAEWDAAMTIATDNLWAAFRNRSASWVNTDVAIAVELFNFGRKTGRQELLDKARYFIDDVLTSGRMFEDGAVGYIGTQNEAGGYQGTVASYVNRYYEMTGHAPALEILRKMEWYGPVNGRMIDWWTSPSWKHAWNFISGSGQTGEATNGKNPYTRADLDASIAAPATSTNWTGQQGHVAWYERGTTPLSRPDYTTFDRNIMGPRGWQGLWNYTGTLRAINDSESGHHTLMGCQIMESSPSFRVNASMMGIFPRIRTSSGPSRNTDGTFYEERHAWLTSKLEGDSTVTPSFSSLAASYKPHVFGSSTKGTEHNWTARQVWLNLPDRVIGLLDMSPNADLTAFEVQGAIRLGYGGTAYSSSKSIAATGAESWEFGDLAVKLHGHNYAAVTPEVYAFRSVYAPFTEITLRDQADGAANTTARTYTAGSRWKFIAEIRPKATTTNVSGIEVADAPGLIGIEVQGPASDKRYRVLYNPGTAAVAHTPALDWGGPIRIHRSGTRFRPDWLPAPSGELPVETLSNGQVITLQPKSHVVLERIPPPDVGATILSPSSEPVTLSSTSQSLHLTAGVTQSGGGQPVIVWSQLDGPGTVVFSNPASLETRASFSQPGVYVLRVTATVDPTVATAERTVIVQPPEDMTFRQGENGYQHAATFIRNDGTGNVNATWNSGARNQMLAGYNSTGAMRALLSYDLTTLPSAFPVRSARLDLWTSTEAGAGTVGNLTLHPLEATPTEGTGSSTSDRNAGSATGATWIRRTDATANINWAAPGGDFSNTILGSVPGYTATITTEELKSFSSSAAFIAAIETARTVNSPLNLLIQSANTSGTNFTRFHSDDSDAAAKRPLLTLGFSNNLLPLVDPGSAPAASVGTPAALTGSATAAATLSWQLVSGPGTASFSDPASATTTVTFDRAGTYLLRLSATNPHGTVSADLTIEASHASAFAAWQDLHWPGFTDPAIIGPNADPDGDGLSNLAEFNAGTNPKDPQSGGASIWTAVETGMPLPWSEGRHWQHQAAPVSGNATALEFLTNQTLPAAEITTHHDLVAPFRLNRLALSGSASGTAAVEITGQALEFSTNGSITPSLQLHASAPLAYRIPAPLNLAANTTISGNGSARFELAGAISGSGSLTKDGGSELILSASNTFTGSITHNAGKLTLGHHNAAGSGAKSLTMQGTNRVLQLTNNITLPSDLTITASSNSFDGGGIHNLSGNNRIEGPVNVSFGNPALNISSSAGTLTLANDVTLVSSSRPLHLGGVSEEDNQILGNISQNAPGNVLSLVKQGAGTWILSGTNSHTGATSVNGGTLVVDGALTQSSSLTVAGNTTLAGSGTVSPPTTIHGNLSPGHRSAATITFSGPLALSSSSAIHLDLTANDSTAANHDRITAAAVDLAEGALIHVSLDSESSTLSFADPFWRETRSWTVLTSTDLVGTPALGQVSADRSGLSAEDGHGRFSLSQSGNSILLQWTPFTDLETWRFTHFGSTANQGDAANETDIDGDGLKNLLEWALDLDPKKPDRQPTGIETLTNTLTFTYTRRRAAAAEVDFSVEWSDTLAEPWTSVGPGELLSETTDRQTLRATIPEGPAGRRFVRLRISMRSD